ncbi:hypothetical protein NPIL_206021 [Nephila pilipes]|uniref:Uncharacterized protein n=1 Tax=Nephila pilipes TaxID=299642 RepID=A0A8X6TZP3_NEPPI|nr:hypothetical protein NPIL_206021 [Nephila pilipes]
MEQCIHLGVFNAYCRLILPVIRNESVIKQKKAHSSILFFFFLFIRKQLYPGETFVLPVDTKFDGVIINGNSETKIILEHDSVFFRDCHNDGRNIIQHNNSLILFFYRV